MILSVFVVLLAGTVSFSYADYISPKKQLDSGVLPEDVICRDDRVLVERTNGNVVCVYVNAAERLGWKIIENGVTFAPETSNEIIIIEESSIEEKEFKVEKTIEIIPKEKTSWIPSATDLSYMDLEKIPNPTGYWVPIEDKNAFVKALVNATGDTLSNENKFGKADYYTKNGKIYVLDFYLRDVVQPSVHYEMYDSFSLISESDQLPFINNFMNSMGFKLTNDKLFLSEEFLETCDGNYFTYSCTLEDNSIISRFIDRGNIAYKLTTQYSEIKFTFFDRSHILNELKGISI